MTMLREQHVAVLRIPGTHIASDKIKLPAGDRIINAKWVSWDDFGSIVQHDEQGYWEVTVVR